MATVRITEQAWSDLDAILDCYDQSAPGFSEVFEEEVVERVCRLEEVPRMPTGTLKVCFVMDYCDRSTGHPLGTPLCPRSGNSHGYTKSREYE